MWQSIKRFADDLYSEYILSVIILIVFVVIGALYIVSGLSNPSDTKEFEQITQSTRIVIGQSLMVTGLSTALIMLLALIITTPKRWKQEDNEDKTHMLVNAIFEQNNLLLDKLNQIALQRAEVQIEDVITESTTSRIELQSGE